MKNNWSKTIKVGKFVIGKKNPSFIIAEGGLNHNGNIGTAKKLIDAAVDANANAIKFQTFITNKVFSKKLSPQVFNMIKKYELTAEDFGELKDYSRKKGILFCSTPFDSTSCDLLTKLHVPFYKIGSGDLDNIPLVIHASKNKKPIFLSTGMSTNQEIIEALNSIAPYNKEIALLHCTSLYPADFSEANLNQILSLKKNFDILVGYSDHTLGFEASLAAVSLGACIIEKHLTLDNNMKGPDHKTSLNPADFKLMIKKIRNVEASFGSYHKEILTREKTIRKVARRSIISIQDIPKGKMIDNNDVYTLRPAGGIKPKYLSKVLGKRAKTNIKEGSLLQWQMLY